MPCAYSLKMRVNALLRRFYTYPCNYVAIAQNVALSKNTYKSIGCK